MSISPKEETPEMKEPSEQEEEGRHIPGQRRVFAPSAEEREAHMRTHIPYRRWCEYCVRGKCKNPGHRQHKGKTRDVPMISYDYMQQKTKEGKEEGTRSLPILVGIDHDTGWISAYMVSKKGFDKYAVGCMVRDVDHSGYNKLILKSDQENSVLDVINATRRERAEHIEIAKEDSSVGEHPENGKIERAIQTLEGQVRTMKLALESRYGTQISETHVIWPWLITYAGMLENIARVDVEGRTSWERRKGRRFIRELPEFGENVMYMKPGSLGKDKAESRWGDSCVFVGIRFESSEILMLTEQGAIKVRSFKRKIESERWNT